jgi:hypothetical protein
MHFFVKAQRAASCLRVELIFLNAKPYEILDALLLADAAKYVWWEPPAEAVKRPRRVIAQVMNLGDFDDVRTLLGVAGKKALQSVLRAAEPGWFNARSWHYWHYALGLNKPNQPVPPMPAREFRPCRQAGAGRPVELPEPWRRSSDTLGGVGALAAALGGVDPTTVRRWAQGRRPNRAAQSLIRQVFLAHGLQAPAIEAAKSQVSNTETR